MVEFIQDREMKKEISSYILNNLTEWFEIPEGRQEYIDNCVDMPFWAYREDNNYIGFIVLKKNSKYTAELYVTGILKPYHRKGIGRMLFNEMQKYCIDKGFEYLEVKTIDAGYYDEYDKTCMFYEKMGFRKLEVFPTLWGKDNPCLVMVMSVK